MMTNMRSGRRNSFADYKPDAHNWITLMTGEYYPDILQEACQLYEPVLVMFGQLLRTSESSVRLFIQISEVPSTWMRVQLLRVYRTGGYRSCADEILSYTQDRNLKTKVIFLNDGPGLLLGSMWDDYANIENSWSERIIVLTLRMVPDRITVEWLRS